MLGLYQPTLRLLVHLPCVPSRALIASSVRCHGSISRTTAKERLSFERKFPVALNCSRHFSAKNEDLTEPQVKRAMDSISEKFTEAMELMNDARSSSGTVYFSEDMVDTQAQVTETLNDYKALLGKLNDRQRKNVIQSIGLKMEELKAQMSLLEDLAKE